MLRRKLFPEDEVENKRVKLNEENSTSDRPLNFSRFFADLKPKETVIPDKFIDIQLELNAVLNGLNFLHHPVEYVYNPVEYAFKSNETYIRKYCSTQKKVVFVGMNPGPFGMCQTGVPFGDVESVRDWLEINEHVNKPLKECPSRPVLGFSCTRREISGQRFWGVLQKISGTPEKFFAQAFVYNYCPLAFMKGNGCNVTPTEIKGSEKKTLEDACDKAYLKILQLVNPDIIIGVGEYAEKKTKTLLKNYSPPLGNIKVLRLPHPSPRAVNNTNWIEKAELFFSENNLLPYLQNGIV